MPQRIQRKRSKGWRMPEGAVTVDRSTGFGNPFPISKGTSTHMGKTETIFIVGGWSAPAMWLDCKTKLDAQKRATDAYRAWLNLPAQEQLRAKARVALRGKDLACWCPPGSPCHADVLLEIANS